MSKEELKKEIPDQIKEMLGLNDEPDFVKQARELNEKIQKCHS